MPTTLPPSTDYTGALVTQGGKKTFIATLRQFLADFAGTDSTPAKVRDNLQIGAGGGRNYMNNPAMQVAQRAALAVTLSTSRKYGHVDQIVAWASGGAVTAGSIVQTAAANCGSTGYACKLSNITLTGAGVVSFAKRLRGRRVGRLKNKTAVVQCWVYHDVGANVPFTIIVRKPNALDNWSGSTVVATSAAIVVPSATATLLQLPATALGDVSNGLEVEIQGACGAVAAKNFETTDWQIAEETLPSTIELPKPELALVECMAELEVIDGTYNYTTGKAFACNNYAGGNQPTCLILYKAQKSAVPTISFPTGAGNVRYVSSAGLATNLNPVTFAVGVDGFSLACTNAPGSAGFGWMDGFGLIFISCELG